MGAHYTTAISNTIPSYSNVSVLKQQQQVMDRSCRAEFDTHADTCGILHGSSVILERRHMCPLLLQTWKRFGMCL